MSKALAAPGWIVDFTAPVGGVVSGQGYQIGNAFGFAERSEVAGNKFPLAVVGVFTCLSSTSDAWTEGQVLYWDNTNRVVTSTASGNLKIGYCVVAKATGATTGLVRLPGLAG